MQNRPHASLLYHYFHPDDVISARLFADLASGLTDRGWDVTAMPCNRSCRDASHSHAKSEQWEGGEIRRIWRPNFKQHKHSGRLLNAAWMIARWSMRSIKKGRKSSNVLVVGTDPVLSVLTAVPWRIFQPRTKIIHWCHDLYPEAPIADGMVRAGSLPVRILKRFLAMAYRQCDVIADLGPCMRRLLAGYGSEARCVTLTPWALLEPVSPVRPDSATRHELFGSARLGLLYSGNFGRAHSYTDFLDLARQLRGSSIEFCFAGRGNKMEELQNAVSDEDSNVSFAGFAAESELEKRLGACDLHLVSLRPEWAGSVVPSKFFGALAAGRGVIYAGPPDSAIAQWVRQYKVGWVLTPETLPTVAAELRRLAFEPNQLSSLRTRCHAVYHEHFSKRIQLDRWDAELRKAVGLPIPPQQEQQPRPPFTFEDRSTTPPVRSAIITQGSRA